MSTIHFKQTTTATPEQFIAGLTDFGPGRGKLFGNSTDQYLKVHLTIPAGLSPREKELFEALRKQSAEKT